MKDLERRLNKAEVAHALALRQVIIWRDLGETPEQTKARHYAKHPADRGAEIMLVGWQDER